MNERCPIKICREIACPFAVVLNACMSSIFPDILKVCVWYFEDLCQHTFIMSLVPLYRVEALPNFAVAFTGTTNVKLSLWGGTTRRY